MITARIKGGKTAALKRLAKSHGISLFTLNRYLKASNRALKTARRDKENSIAAQLEALTPAYGKNAGKTRAWPPEALEYAKSIYGSEGFTRQTEVYRQTVSKAQENGWKEGSYDSLRRFLMKAVD
jgi:dsRNA-specific ribonuclease